jgi:UDP-N-acetylglucosamine transferase subunit ALG13
VIFLTVGTTKFSFNRLLRGVDEAMNSLRTKERLVAQIGKSDYEFKYKNTDAFGQIPFNKMIDYLKKARIVITHGGPATIFLVLKHNKNKPLVIPRMKKFGEHVDDHQVYFTELFKKRRLIEVPFSGDKLVFRIVSHLKQPKAVKNMERLLPSKMLIEKLIDYTENIKR